MEDILQQKAYDFALRIVKLSEFLHDKKHEFVLSRKVLDSGTNIGLLIEEGKQGENKSDFVQKYSVGEQGSPQDALLLRAAMRFEAAFRKTD